MIIAVNNEIGKKNSKEFYTYEELILEMKENSIDKAVVCSFADYIDNEYVLKAAKENSNLIPSLTINPKDDKEVKKIDQYINEGFKGINLYPLHHGYSLGNKDLLKAVLDKANEYKLPVWIFSTADVYCNPIFIGDLASNYPNVNFVIGYMGFNYEAGNAVGLAKKYSNIYLDPTAAMYLNLKRAIDNAGPNKVLFAAGVPSASFFDIEKYKIEALNLSLEDKEEIYNLNARKLYKVD